MLGWVGYLVARAVFSRRILWIAVAVLVFFFFGGLFGALAALARRRRRPGRSTCSGSLAGVLAGWVLHPRRARRAKPA